MKSVVTTLVVIFLLAGGLHEAHAGFMFGKGEKISHVANVTLKGPSGEQLYLARKITIRAFIAPYSVSDDGFVFGISGEAKKYYPLPSEGKIKLLQDAGQLPKPLPKWEIGTIDWLYGHLLWLLLAGGVGFWTLKGIARKFESKKTTNSFWDKLKENISYDEFMGLVRMMCFGFLGTSTGIFILKDAITKDMGTMITVIGSAMLLVGIYALWRCLSLIYNALKT